MALKPDSWLGGLLGKPAWHLSPAARDFDRIAMPDAGGPCFVDAKVPVGRTDIAAKLQDAGFRLIDTNVQMERPAWPAGRSRASRFAVAADRTSVERIAEKGFSYSRFHLDPLIPRSVADRIKRAWAGNYFEGSRGDAMVVAEVGGEVAGFMQIIRQGDVIIYDLCAIDDRFRGKGLARDLIAFAEANIPGIELVRLGTQIANASAMRSWLADRFQFVSASYVFHYHG